MSDITRQQFALAVAAAISSVHHLYKEVNLLLVGLREALSDEPSPFAPVRGTLGKSGRNPGRLVMRDEYGVLFAPVNTDNEEEVAEDEDDEDMEDEGEESEAGQKDRKRSPIEIAGDQPLLAIRIAIYDPGRQEAFEPEIRYAVMNDWTVGNDSKPAQHLVLARSMLRRVPRALAGSAGIRKGGRIRTRAVVRRVVGAKKSDSRRLSCRLPMGVETVPLYSLENAEELHRLAQGMKKMWALSMNEE